MSRVRVLLHLVEPDDSAGAVADAYHRVSQRLEGTPGLLGNELLGSVHEPGGFVVMSEWRALDVFRAWQSTPRHGAAAPLLRPYHDPRRPFDVYTVRAAYH